MTMWVAFKIESCRGIETKKHVLGVNEGAAAHELMIFCLLSTRLMVGNGTLTNHNQTAAEQAESSVKLIFSSHSGQMKSDAEYNCESTPYIEALVCAVVVCFAKNHGEG